MAMSSLPVLSMSFSALPRLPLQGHQAVRGRSRVHTVPGKSSLALLLDAAFGPAGQTRDAALALLNSVSVAGQEVERAHEQHRTEQRGFHRGLVTAHREPLPHTVLRALFAAVCRSYGNIPPTRTFQAANILKQALEDAEASTRDPRRTGPSPAALLETARCLASDGPLLLVFDEFGKNLEAVADKAATSSSDTDPYLGKLHRWLRQIGLDGR